MKIPYEDAVSNSTRNRLSKYPTRADDRLEPVAKPSFETGIHLSPGDRIVTMGSCFARNIEEYLGTIGFVVPVLGYSGPVEESGTRGRVQGILNKYTVASISQEIDWIKEIRDAGGTVTWDSIAAMAYQTDSDAYLDLHLSTSHPVSRERMIERRQAIYDIHSQMFESDLVVITPGLTEAWFDAHAGLYIQQAPTRAMANAHPGRFFLEVLDFHQCHSMLERSIGILKDAGTRQIALTVSPVPLARTMTRNDVLIANCYSKSTLRSVVGLLADSHDTVHYVPSYERVMLTKQNDVWNDDLRHVSDSFVGGIVSTFASAAGHQATDIGELLLGFNAASLAEDSAEALRLFAKIEEGLAAEGGSFERIPTFEFHKNAAALMVKAGRIAEGLRFASIMQAIRPHKAIGYIREINLRIKSGDPEKAKQAAVAGLKSCDAMSIDWLKKTIDKSFDAKTRTRIYASAE